MRNQTPQAVILFHRSHAVAAEFEASTAPEWLAFVRPPTGDPRHHGFASTLRAFMFVSWWGLLALLNAVEWLVKTNASWARAFHPWNLSRLFWLTVCVRQCGIVWWGMWFLSFTLTHAFK
jgi:hypothetical protein